MLFVVIYVYCCPTRLPYLIMFVSFNSNTKDVTSGVETASLPEHLSSLLILSGYRVAQSLVMCSDL